ncbi:hypothetical protein N9N14_02520 [Candidatus Poseidonia alphae]|nr:hypothetical protein [Candidatus Poseidonia alphae]
MSKVGRKMSIVVDGQVWRAEDYIEASCVEVVVRGPWTLSQGAFQPNGKPRFKKGHYTAWKQIGETAICVNTKKSSKQKSGDPDKSNLQEEVWRPFQEAYAKKRGWVA